MLRKHLPGGGGGGDGIQGEKSLETAIQMACPTGGRGGLVGWGLRLEEH